MYVSYGVHPSLVFLCYLPGNIWSRTHIFTHTKHVHTHVKLFTVNKTIEKENLTNKCPVISNIGNSIAEREQEPKDAIPAGS